MTLDLSQLAGHMHLVPGAVGRPAITSTRPDILPRLTVGRPAAQLPGLLASVFTLCAHAHRWTAQRAVHAALGQTVPVTEADLQAHRLATLREQILRISHDWPRLLPGAPPVDSAALLLRSCPVWRDDLPADERLAALPAWLAQPWLGMAPEAWLAAFHADPTGWPVQWAQRGSGPVALLLRSQRSAAQALPTPGTGLDLLSNAAVALPMLARAMATQPQFCAQPLWQGEAPDTGPWTRHADPLRRPAHTAWDRLVARVVEVLRLAAPDGAHWLSHGTLALGPGEGLAWTEMARGLLVHRVRLLDVGPGAPTVAACQVLAPTEWNFHPNGVLARALQALPAGPTSAEAAARLAVAFDPCVPFTVDAGPALAQDGDMTRKTHHA